MKALKTVSVTFVLALAAAAPAFASDEDCPKVPREQWRAQADARAAVEALGYRVEDVGIDDGCYAVRAVDKNGKPYDIKLTGKKLRMVSRYAVKRELASRRGGAGSAARARRHGRAPRRRRCGTGLRGAFDA
jgi:hypothetical protein